MTFALEYGLVRDTPYGAALAALALAGFYVLLATWMKRRPELGITFDATLAIATIFLTLVIPFALDERSTAGAWTLEGAGLIWIGFRQQRGLPRLFGYLLLGLAGLAMLLGHERHGAPTLVFNAYLFNGLMAAAASLARRLLRPSRRPRRRPQARRGSVRDAADRVGDGLVRRDRDDRDRCVRADAASRSPSRSPPRARSRAVRGARHAASTGRRSPGRRSRTRRSSSSPPRSTRRCSPIRSQTAAGGRGRSPSPRTPLVLRLRRAVLAEARSRTRCTRSARSRSRSSAPCSAARSPRAGATPRAPGRGSAGSSCRRRCCCSCRGRRRRGSGRCALLPEAYQTSAAAVLAAGLWLWTLVANVASDGSAAPLPYLPFLNPLDIGIGIALAATLLWLKHADRVAPWSLAMAAGAGFVWLNAILVRSFHHYAGVPYHVDAWLDSLAVQTGITLLWTAIALATMWLASTRAAREPWIVGAALLAAVVSSCSSSISRAAARDADRLVHRRRRADARHRLRRAVAGRRRFAMSRPEGRALRARRGCFSPARCSPPRSRAPSRRRTATRRRSRSTRRHRSCRWRCRSPPTATSSRTTCATCASSTRRGERVPVRRPAAAGDGAAERAGARGESLSAAGAADGGGRLAVAGRRRRRRRSHQRAPPRRPGQHRRRRAARFGRLADRQRRDAARRAAAAGACTLRWSGPAEFSVAYRHRDQRRPAPMAARAAAAR